MKPVVFVGQKGLTRSVEKALEEALNAHELIKVRFVDFKEKDEKSRLAQEIEKNHQCDLVGMVGHVAIFFRRHPDSQKRKIDLPDRSA